MTTQVRCPRCRSDRVTDGSSRLVTILGVILLGIGILILFGLCPLHQVTDWSHFTVLQDHDARALLVVALGLILIWGGSRRPETLFCEACGYRWERTSRPKVQLRPTNRHRGAH